MEESLVKENKPQNQQNQECNQKQECAEKQECKENKSVQVQKEKGKEKEKEKEIVTENIDPKYKLPPEVGRTRTVDILICKKCKATFQVCDCCLANGYGCGNKTKNLVVYKSQKGRWFYKFHDEFKKLNKGCCAEEGCDGQVVSEGFE